ncbi:GRAM domain-containing protein 2B [Aplysia californica]|uniref:GRAM domain-containing protein 2B n=1 Tax=Aplysia californica TaxID=6500 RepID=A0ABM0JB50_APLCA|nr:GRAM domain-containing protein 2B [Aplysia californica]
MHNILNDKKGGVVDVPGTVEIPAEITLMGEPLVAGIDATSAVSPKTDYRKSANGSSSTNIEHKSDSSPGPKTPINKVPDVSDLPQNVSKSRTLRFHKLFKSTPVEEYPIECFSCAFKGDILLQGQMYVSHNWICFYSKIKARGRLIEIPLERVISITREKLALFIPNAIGIQTADQKYVFGSFISRDSTYKKLVTLWKLNHDSTSGNVSLPVNSGTSILGHNRSPDTSESDTTEDDLNPYEVLDRVLAPSVTGCSRRVEVEVNRLPEPKGSPSDRTQQCLNCKSVFRTFCSFSYKLQKVPRTNLLLAICTILVFFLMLSAMGLTYKILVLQSRMEVGSFLGPHASGSFRDRAMGNLYWLQTETHASVIRQLHSVLESNIHLLEEVEGLLKDLFREPGKARAAASHLPDPK